MILETRIDLVEPIWKSIEEKFTDSNFSSFSWCEVYRDSFPDGNYFYVYSDNFIIPFELKKISVFDVLTIQGGKGVDFFTPLINQGFDFSKCLDFLREKIKFDCFYIPRSKVLFNGLKSKQYFESSAASIRSENTIFEDLIKDKVVKDTKRQIKRISELGKLSYSMVDTENALKYFDIFKAMKIEQQKNLNAPSILTDVSYSNFYFNLIKKKSGDLVHFSFLSLGDEVISMHLGIKNKKQYIYLLPTYSPKYQNFSPGRIHLFELFKYCDETSIVKFDFSVGSEGYKKYFCNSEEVIYINYKSFNLLGLIYIFIQLFKNKMNKYPKIRELALKLKS